MVDINRHRFYLVQILKEIYSDLELAYSLGFKGGSALMFFYDLPRFSVDLDFNLLDADKEEVVYEKVRKIILKYGTIFDETKKLHGPIIVLDYGVRERKMKVEISTRIFDNSYEVKNLLGINIKVMVQEDMFAHKLSALLDRNAIANRDIFDCWFFMQRQTPVNSDIIESRTGMSYKEYMQNCIEQIGSISSRGLLQGMGELLEPEMKRFVQVKLHSEVIRLLKFYKEYPILRQ